MRRPSSEYRIGRNEMARTVIFILFIAFSLGSETSATTVGDTAPGVQVLVAYHSVTGNTEKMAVGVAEGAKGVSGTVVVLRRVQEVTAQDLFLSSAVVVGSPVYWSNMAGEVKTFLDNWQLKFGVYPEFKMRDKIGAAFVTGGQVSGGKELVMLSVLAAMLGNQMIVVSGGGAFGASATTESGGTGIDENELESARQLGKRVAEVAWMMKRGK
jgi:NAD(P)H dehydrogenase (quinone)